MVDCWLKNRTGNPEKAQCSEKHCDDPNGCLILYKLNYLYEEAEIPVPLRKNIELRYDVDGTDYDKFCELFDIQENIVDFVNQGKQVYIYSEISGNGKTSWALRLVQKYFNKIWLKTDLKCRALFINVPSFLIALKDNISSKTDYVKKLKEKALDADLVVWDDIGNKMGTEFEISNLLSLINTRINTGKANIYTSNISPKQLGEVLDTRLASRVANGSKCVEFKGGDKRNLMVNGGDKR